MASMPRTPTPLSTSSDLMRAGPSVFTGGYPTTSVGRQRRWSAGSVAARDAQTVRVQHALQVLAAGLISGARSIAWRLDDDADGVAGTEDPAEVLVEALMIAADDQHMPQHGQRRGRVPQPEGHLHLDELARRCQEMVLGAVTATSTDVQAADAQMTASEQGTHP